MGCTNTKNQVHPVNINAVPQYRESWYDRKVRKRARKLNASLRKCFGRQSKVAGSDEPSVPAAEKNEDALSDTVSVSDSEISDVSTLWLSDTGSCSSTSSFVPPVVSVTDLPASPPQFKIDPVPRDGNCLFEAAARQLGRGDPSIAITAQQLREDLVRYIRAHSEKFAIAAAVPGGFWAFIRELNNLSRQGHWCSDVADILPIALADYTSRIVVLITGNPDMPYIFLPPEGEESGTPLYLAYYNNPGGQHYDAVKLVEG
ncbi:uncharacterized protein LOC118423249 [Branchiostoma floridae]|uniref:Small ribosomal subunit protein mS31 n=1 Tax=Branchiostoma floridae TaxID=7739 RepID=A0A9J7LRI0_BRAFL|nr:uncharacterized protein LOC118423249 [Branchiostoma floridae]